MVNMYQWYYKYYAQEIQHDESKRNNYGVAVP